MKFIDSILKIYNSSVQMPTWLKRCRADKALRYTIRKFAQYTVPFYFKCTQEKIEHRLTSLHKSANGRKIIVSLTSFPARINYVWMVVECILRQQTQPTKVILWLSEIQFPDKEALPKELLKQIGRGLEIRMVEGDLRSHKKYFYAFQEYPNDYVVLVDDDLLYPSTMIGDLLNGMDAHKVNCSYGSIIQYSSDGKLRPYEQWNSINAVYQGDDFFFGSGGGTMIRPACLYKDSLNLDLIMSLCPKADDIWLNTMCRLSGVKIAKVRSDLIFPIVIENDVTLFSENLGAGWNNEQLGNIREYYISAENVDPFMPNKQAGNPQ